GCGGAFVLFGGGGGPGAGLVDVDRELVVVSALGNLGRGGRDRLCDVRVEQAELRVRLGRGLLDEGERPDERTWEPLPGDREVEDGALGGRAVQRVPRHVHL